MRVYPVLARNDLSDNLLQFVDVTPNTSLATGQQLNECNTGYGTWDAIRDPEANRTTAGTTTTDEVCNGLQGYLLDNVDNVGGGHIILTKANCNTISLAIVGRVASGLDLELADINLLINAAAGVTISDLNGVVANSRSTGSVEAIMRILAGEVYRLPAGSVGGNPGTTFTAAHVPAGAFLTAADSDFRDTRIYRWTGSMNLSCLSGQLSKMNDPAYTWLNPLFTYGAAGTALTIAEAHIGTAGSGRAVVVYRADGLAL